MTSLRELLDATFRNASSFPDTGLPLFVQSTTLTTKWGLIVLNPDGTNISGGGGGGGGGADVQYVDGVAAATPTGNQINWNDAGTQRAVSAAKPLPITVANASLAVTGTFFQATQPVSAATLPLPTGAATAAKQPALGTAGTASADVISVQGIASMTPLQVTQSGTWNITNVSGTVSLPTGASTAAKQPALGTAGTASADVITIQGIASMTALSVTLGAETTKVIGVVRTADGSGNLLTSTSSALDVNLKTSSITLNVSLAAETTKVIGVVRTADGSGNLLTSTSNALDVNLKTSSITLNVSLAAETTKVIGVTRTADGSGNLLTSTSSALDVNIKTSAATNMSMNLAQVGGTTVVNGGTAGSQAIGGVVANNGTINSAVNPVLVGGQAVSSENAVNTTAKLSQFVTDLVGKLIVLPYANPENFISSSLAVITDNTTHSLFTAQAAGVRTYITQITVTNSHATVGTLVSIKDGASGTILHQGYAAPAGGGFTATFPVPLKGTAATLVEAICGTTGASVYVCGSGYKGV